MPALKQRCYRARNILRDSIMYLLLHEHISIRSERIISAGIHLKIFPEDKFTESGSENCPMYFKSTLITPYLCCRYLKLCFCYCLEQEYVSANYINISAYMQKRQNNRMKITYDFAYTSTPTRSPVHPEHQAIPNKA